MLLPVAGTPQPASPTKSPSPVRLRETNALFKLLPAASTPVIRVIVLGNGNLSAVAEHMTIAYTTQSDQGFIAFGSTARAAIPSLTRLPGVEKVLPDIRVQYDFPRRLLSQPEQRVSTDMFRIRQLLGADEVNTKLNITGKDVVVALVDTGVDFGHPDLTDALLRDPLTNAPVMLDADSQGVALTEAEFKANVTNGVLQSTPEVFVNLTGVYLATHDFFVPTWVWIWQAFGLDIESSRGVFIDLPSWQIGRSSTDYIRSLSGVYHFGIMIQYVFSFGEETPLPFFIPLLLVDEKETGRYDTVYADLSLYYDAEFSFYDEKPRRIGDGTEFLTRDFTDDGVPEISGGTLGARFLDPFGIVSDNKSKPDELAGFIQGALYPPLDPKGNFLNLMYDFVAHGTSTASNVASRGTLQYDLYGNGTKKALAGIAPGAKILPITALWLGDIVYGWLWGAGFEYDVGIGRWIYTGKHRADISSNSWGISEWPLLLAGTGFSLIDSLEDALSIPGYMNPDYPGTLFVHSAGNSGFGYGTVHAASFALTVGASTSTHWPGSLAAPSQIKPSTIADDVVPFSSRGPNTLGEPKPDVVNVGAFGFTPTALYAVTDGSQSFTVFGGTSQSAALTAGTAALIVEAARKVGAKVSPSFLKSVIMATARDVNNDPLTQGAGRVDALAAVSYVLSMGGETAGPPRFRASTPETSRQLQKILNSTWTEWLARILVNASVPAERLEDSNWFAGRLSPGDAVSAAFTVDNPSNRPLALNISATSFTLIETKHFENRTEGVANKAYHLNVTKIFGKAPDADLTIFRLSYDFDLFWNQTEVFGTPQNLLYFFLYNWNDTDADGTPTLDEFELVTSSTTAGTVQEIRVGKLNQRIPQTPELRIRQAAGTANVTYALDVFYYKRTPFNWIQATPTTLRLTGKTQASFQATLTTPPRTPPGLYQAYLELQGNNSQTQLVPITFAVTPTFDKDDMQILVRPAAAATQNGPLYDPLLLNGGFDWSWRYDSGDWRIYPFRIEDEYVNMATLRLEWVGANSSMDFFVLDPTGNITATTVPALWNYLGNGVHFPSPNAGKNVSVLAIPITERGVYTLVVHNTLATRLSLPAGLSIFGSAFTVLPDTVPPSLEVQRAPPFAAGTFSVQVQATDANLYKVLYAVDGQPLTQISSPTSLTIDTTSLPDGTHVLTVVATDAVNHETRSSQEFIVDNTKPTIFFLSPSEGVTVTGNLTLRFAVFDAYLQQVQLRLGNVTDEVTARHDYLIDTSRLPDDTHTVSLTATDRAGNTASATLSFKTTNQLLQTINNLFLYSIVASLVVASAAVAVKMREAAKKRI